MPDGSAWEFSRTTDQSLHGIPATALGMWCPWLVGAAKWNAQVQEGFGTVASEWQNFVSRRLKEDFAFMQRVPSAARPTKCGGACGFLAEGDGGLRQGVHAHEQARGGRNAQGRGSCSMRDPRASRDAFPSMLGGDGGCLFKR